MSVDLHFRDKIRVAVLGATGCVGQKFIQKLVQHPWFDLVAVCASERSVGRPYGEVVHWLMETPLPDDVAAMIIEPCHPSQNCQIVFSGLDSTVAGVIEAAYAQAGYAVISNSSHYRMAPQVPLVIGEVNPDHLALVKKQNFEKGLIVTNPNCSAIGLTLALKPVYDLCGIEALHVTTFQSVSGAGYPGVASLDILDNVIPYISGEEEKLQQEPLKLLGRLTEEGIEPAQFVISAQCNRVPVTTGHLATVSIKLKEKVEPSRLIAAWRGFRAEPQERILPSAPFHPLYYFEEKSYPQPKLHRSLEKEMGVAIGGLRACPLFDYKFTVLSHNTMRGAVGSALLNAELLVKQGYIYW